MSKAIDGEQISLRIAVLTISDSRTLETDSSGQFLVDSLEKEGHKLQARDIIVDDVYKIRAQVATWIADESIQVILTTGGTGFTRRDSTPEAVSVLFDKTIEGFGELFRAVSYTEIGSSTIQSRALAGLSNDTIVFCMPGSNNACQTAWHKILKEQLDSRHRPCNYAGVLSHRMSH